MILNRTVVDVHSVVRDKDGNIIADEIIQHIYVIEEGLIRSMEISKPEVSSPAAPEIKLIRCPSWGGLTKSLRVFNATRVVSQSNARLLHCDFAMPAQLSLVPFGDCLHQIEGPGYRRAGRIPILRSVN